MYQYGAVPQQPPCASALEQLRLANDLWNHLVEIDRHHHSRMREIMASVPEMAHLIAERERLAGRLADLRGAVKSARQQARARTRADPVTASAIREIREALGANGTAIRDARKRAVESVAPLLRENEAQRRGAIKTARREAAASGLYWGTYNAVLQSYDTAHQAAWKTGAELRFRRYDGTGRWVVQVQTETGQEPTRIADVLSGRCQVLAIEAPAQEWEEIVARNGRTIRRHRMPVVRIRIGSGEHRKPIWLKMPILYHRPIPEDAQIVGAVLTRRRVGTEWRHDLCITVREPNTATIASALPVTAIDIGWRGMLDGEVRTGYARSDDGWTLEIRLPERVRGAFAKAADIRSLRDHNFNAARDRLADWLIEAPHVPSWLRDRTRTLRQWRSAAGLRRLCEDWRDQPFPGDEVEYAALREWRARDSHLLEYEAQSRDQAAAHRRDAYRCYAAEIARRSSVVLLKKFDLRAVTRRPQAEEEGPPDANRRLERWAAPGLLRQYIRQACAMRGVRVVEAPAEGTTRRHWHCGQEVVQDYAANVRVYCPHCAEWYDQDDNATRNLLRGYAIGPREPFSPGSARESTATRPRGRFQRARVAREERRDPGRSREESTGQETQGV